MVMRNRSTNMLQLLFAEVASNAFTSAHYNFGNDLYVPGNIVSLVARIIALRSRP